MPNPFAQKFKPIAIPELMLLPIEPRPWKEYKFGSGDRWTMQRLSDVIAKIPANFLSDAEIDLLVHVVVSQQAAFVWTDDERGTFSPRYFPDYEMPVIKHIPWAQPPIRIPKAIEEKVKSVIK
ncbi:hypothetical protein WOLCODRAFT_86636 [Wolfiporia cocos MD-104 SS10]|uniref:Uncharacterized protein n=1 Tax=Wolfiporia cocos (strain MD-104) TaxID=742152 RepID=A0A2H3JB89_WOLCO|nr:hypothetical protein WOLCODRAFT_86636 [Wolfiporia cocos MD-104 SS10]